MMNDGFNTPPTTDRFNAKVKRAEFSINAEQEFCFPTFAELQKNNFKSTDIDLFNLHINLLKLEQSPLDICYNSNFLNFRIENTVRYEMIFFKIHSFILYMDDVELWRQDFKKNGKCIINDGDLKFVPYVMYLQNYIENVLIERDSTIIEESATDKLWRNIKELECETN